MKKLYSLVCAAACTLMMAYSMSSMAQRMPNPVEPGSLGTIPTSLPVIAPAHDGEFVGLVLDRYNIKESYFGSLYGDVDLKFPDASWKEVQYYTLLVNGSVYTDDGEPVKYKHDNATIRQDYASQTYRLVAHGGPWDGMMSNELVVNIPVEPVQTQVRSFFWNGTAGVVGTKVDAPEVELYNYNPEVSDEQLQASFQYRWLRRNPNTYEDAVIEGATGTTYTPTLEDVGYILVAQVCGDNRLSTFTVECNMSNGEPVYLPVYCSLDYYDNDGYILNCAYELPDFATKLKAVSPRWEDNGEVTYNEILPAEAVELQKGKYMMVADMDIYSHCELMYDFGNPNVKLAAKYGDGEFTMIRELMLRVDEAGRAFNIKNSRSPVSKRKLRLFGKNIKGEMALKHVLDMDQESNEVYAPVGNYYVVLGAGFPAELPTYYPSATTWKQAEMVAFEGWDNPELEIDVQQVQGMLFAGTCKIEGSVQRQVSTRAAAGSLKGIFIYLLDKNKQIVATTYTDEDGSYSFLNLSEGTYYISPEFAGWEASTSDAITMEEGESAVVSYIIGNGSIIPTAGDDEDGIASMGAARANGWGYDLSGRRTSVSGKGIFIVEKRKVATY